MSLLSLLTLFLAGIVSISCENQTLNQKYQLCTYTRNDFDACQHTISEAEDLLLDFPLKCVRRYSVQRCIDLVKEHKADLVILTEHQYQIALNARLKPVIYERLIEDENDVYIAVAPRNIGIVDINEAPIIVDRSDGRAFHAAAYFNLRRGHDICRFINNAVFGAYVYIMNSANYVVNDDEILLCPDHTWSLDPSTCNFEAGLQTAVFMRRNVAQHVIWDVKERIFDRILENFGIESQQPINEGNSIYFGQFKNTATGFDLAPTYRNGVYENVFSLLHCHNEFGAHNPSILEA